MWAELMTGANETTRHLIIFCNLITSQVDVRKTADVSLCPLNFVQAAPVPPRAASAFLQVWPLGDKCIIKSRPSSFQQGHLTGPPCQRLLNINDGPGMIPFLPDGGQR